MGRFSAHTRAFQVWGHRIQVVQHGVAQGLLRQTHPMTCVQHRSMACDFISSRSSAHHPSRVSWSDSVDASLPAKKGQQTRKIIYLWPTAKSFNNNNNNNNRGYQFSPPAEKILQAYDPPLFARIPQLAYSTRGSCAYCVSKRRTKNKIKQGFQANTLPGRYTRKQNRQHNRLGHLQNAIARAEGGGGMRKGRANEGQEGA